MSFYSAAELEGLGLACFGVEVKISKKASIYHPERISIGNHVRIDDYCVISSGVGGIYIGNYVHIAVFCSLIGGGKISLADFCGLSSRVSLYSSNDDYSGEYMTNPTVSSEFTNVKQADVFIGKHAIIGSGAVVLPGVTLEEGVSIAALSLVNNDCSAFGIFAGKRRIGERKRNLLELEKEFLSNLSR